MPRKFFNRSLETADNVKSIDERFDQLLRSINKSELPGKLKV